MKQGSLIVIEGIDGAGKTTQARTLLARLRREGAQAEIISFPRYSTNIFGRLIRDFLDGRQGDFAAADPYLAATLYAADRFESKETIERWLAKGTIVICNRYVSSNQIHQGGKLRSAKKRAAFLTWLEAIEYGTFGLPRPSLVLYLSLRPQLAGKLLSRKDGVERNRRYNMQSFRMGEKLARVEKWTRIAGEEKGKILTRGAVHEKVYLAVKKMLK